MKKTLSQDMMCLVSSFLTIHTSCVFSWRPFWWNNLPFYTTNEVKSLFFDIYLVKSAWIIRGENIGIPVFKLSEQLRPRFGPPKRGYDLSRILRSVQLSVYGQNLIHEIRLFSKKKKKKSCILIKEIPTFSAENSIYTCVHACTHTHAQPIFSQSILF